MKLVTTIEAPVLDMFSRDWEFDGKKGTTHFVIAYDYESHSIIRLVVDDDDSKLFDTVCDLALLQTYKLKVVLDESFDKVRKQLIGVEAIGK